MTQKCYDVAILGATFLGLGAALSLKNAVVIEKADFFGTEFINNYKVCKPQLINSTTELGTHFADNLRKRKLISASDDIYQAPAMYVISSYLKQNPVEILLMTETIEVKKENGVYSITVYHAKGFETILAKKLLNTTLNGIGCSYNDKLKIKKTLNSIIYNPEKRNMENLYYNTASDVYTFSMAISFEKTRYDAVEELLVMANVFQNNKMRISSIAPDFSYELEPFCYMEEQDYIWNPSIAYANLVEAFDVGVSVAERIGYDYT